MPLLNSRRYRSIVSAARNHRLSGTVRERRSGRHIRRLHDCAIASLLLAMASPLMLLVALAIKLESAGPVLVKHTCIGRGRRFQMLKFRTTVDADPDRMMPIWAEKTTQVGQFLRYSRIEALPQLLNVLRGEMSLIDPDGSSPTFLD